MLIFFAMNQTCAEIAANGDGISCLAFQLWEEAGCPEGGIWSSGWEPKHAFVFPRDTKWTREE
jgi:hypothetical protein